MSRKELEIERKKEEIIKAAEDLFFTIGFDGTSMDEISKNSEFSKRTVYKYFFSKEELYATIAYRGLCVLKDLIENELNSSTNISEAMHKMSKSLMKLHKSNKNYPRAISGLLSIISRSSSDGIYLKKCIETLNGIFDLLKEILRRGIKDGSIKKDIDINKTVYSIQMIFAGIYSINKNIFKFVKIKEDDITFEEIFEYNFNLIIMAIKK